MNRWCYPKYFRRRINRFHLLSIGIMQDKKGLARKYTPLVNYLKNYGISVKLVGFHSYRDAAIKFKNGKIDAMFAGSGVAGAMIIKKLAYPLVRPVHDGNWSTYWAVVIVPESTTDFKMTPEYMRPKRIICSALASSGEFFCRTLYSVRFYSFYIVFFNSFSKQIYRRSVCDY